MDIEIIQNYILHLMKDCGLSVSLHPMKDERLITCSALIHFNVHNNSYCSFIKSLPNAHTHCLSQQKEIFNRCCKNHESFCSVCYAGVKEYVYPLHDKNTIIGFVTVSGYADENEEQYTSFISKHFDCSSASVSREYHKLKANLPDKRSVDTLILPLCKMLELAYLKELRGPVSDSLNDAICRYIQRNYSVELTADLICKNFSCSKSYFSHSFKNHTGQSFREYLTNIRLNHAKQLLEHSDLSVTQISFSVGFNDSNYFSNVFKEKIGISPLRYRKSKTACNRQN